MNHTTRHVDFSRVRVMHVHDDGVVLTTHAYTIMMVN